MNCTCQAPPSMGFSRQDHWSGLPFPSPGDLTDPGIKPASPALVDGFFTTREAPKMSLIGNKRNSENKLVKYLAPEFRKISKQHIFPSPRKKKEQNMK